MRCPSCLHATHVLDTRPAGDTVVRRRRECLSCGHRFTTLERKAVEQVAAGGPKVAA
jgi:transcriptional repressor NrdR